MGILLWRGVVGCWQLAEKEQKQADRCLMNRARQVILSMQHNLPLLAFNDPVPLFSRSSI